jgi:hypothetical protein
MPGEKQAVYHPQISTQFPYFFLQTHFTELEPWIGAAKHRPRKPKSNELHASIYVGKGKLEKVPNTLRHYINRSKSKLITRTSPATKYQLYEELSNSDLVISCDPLTSLAYEAILIGVPVFIPAKWDEDEFLSVCPVRLDGIVWRNTNALMKLLTDGFDHDAVVGSYRSALNHNTDSLLRLLSYAFESQTSQPSAKEINDYWIRRQPFFASLELSFDHKEWSINEALPAQNLAELLQDFRHGLRKRNPRIHKITSRLKSSLKRRLDIVFKDPN